MIKLFFLVASKVLQSGPWSWSAQPVSLLPARFRGAGCTVSWHCNIFYDSATSGK